MNSWVLIKTLTEIGEQWMDNYIQPNVGPYAGPEIRRRRDGIPQGALLVFGDLGADEGHKCFSYEPEEGCAEEGHDNYQFVAWIDYIGKAHYQKVSRHDQ